MNTTHIVWSHIFVHSINICLRYNLYSDKRKKNYITALWATCTNPCCRKKTIHLKQRIHEWSRPSIKVREAKRRIEFPKSFHLNSTQHNQTTRASRVASLSICRFKQLKHSNKMQFTSSSLCISTYDINIL